MFAVGDEFGHFHHKNKNDVICPGVPTLVHLHFCKVAGEKLDADVEKT